MCYCVLSEDVAPVETLVSSLKLMGHYTSIVLSAPSHAVKDKLQYGKTMIFFKRQTFNTFVSFSAQHFLKRCEASVTFL